MVSYVPPQNSTAATYRPAFGDCRILQINVLDTGVLVHSNAHKYYALSLYSDVVKQLGFSISKDFGKHSHYTIAKVNHKLSSGCQQAFTFPFKYHPNSWKFRSNTTIRSFYTQVLSTSSFDEELFIAYQKNLSNLPNDKALSRKRPLVVVILVNGPGHIYINSPASIAAEAFTQKGWLCQTLIDPASPEIMSSLKNASCIILDNYEYLIGISSSQYSMDDFATRLRLMGYGMMMIAMSPSSKKSVGNNIYSYDEVISDVINKATLASTAKKCSDKLLATLLSNQLDANLSW